MKKKIVIDHRAQKVLKSLDENSQELILILVEKLKELGYLNEPEGKKMSQYLFELRVRDNKILWRGIYAYISNDTIIILHIFQKNTQKTPLKEIETANKRLQDYIY